MAILGIDVSHYQGRVDMAAVRGSGRDFTVLKASEGVDYTDPAMAGFRHDAHAAGLVVGLYHFARAGSPTAEAAHFLATVGGLAVGEFLVLDWEVTAPDPVGWCTTWLDTVTKATGVKPLVYLNQSTATGHDWAPVIAAGHGLWLAKYDGSTTAIVPGGWPSLAMKQYTDRGSAPGVAGGVDCDVFYGDRAALLRYGKQAPAPKPAPAPAPKPAPKPTPKPTPVAKPAPAKPFDVRGWRANRGDTGPIFTALQQWANRFAPAYKSTPITPAPVYGPATAAFLAEYCARHGIRSDGQAIGPRTAALLDGDGFRP